MRSNLAQSPLQRLLAGWTAAEAEAPAMDFAERLSVGLGALDAIRLQSALQAIRALPPGGTAEMAPAARLALGEDLRRARSVLAEAIAQDPLALAKARLAAADTARGDKAAPTAGETVYGAFHERHLELQRKMELMTGPLRSHVRDAASRMAPALRQLAALDAALAQVLEPREQALLPALPALLKKRFEVLRRQHQDAGDDGGWLDAFAGEWRQALLAELDLRLAPIAALVAALESDPPR